jgi:hypothetical protein
LNKTLIKHNLETGFSSINVSFDQWQVEISQKRDLLVVEQIQFWIVKLTIVEHPTSPPFYYLAKNWSWNKLKRNAAFIKCFSYKCLLDQERYISNDHSKWLTSLKINITLSKDNNNYFYSAKKTSSIVITLWHHYSEIWMQKKL